MNRKAYIDLQIEILHKKLELLVSRYNVPLFDVIKDFRKNIKHTELDKDIKSAVVGSLDEYKRNLIKEDMVRIKKLFSLYCELGLSVNKKDDLLIEIYLSHLSNKNKKELWEDLFDEDYLETDALELFLERNMGFTGLYEYRNKKEGVYLIRADDIPGVYKVGKATNPLLRLHQFQIGSPSELTLIYYILCESSDLSYKCERYFHELFRKKRKFRNDCKSEEWFYLDGEDIIRFKIDSSKFGKLIKRSDF